MANTGIKTVLTLRKYVDGVATSEVKINDPADPDYIAPYEDLVDCPVSSGVTPTTTTTSQAQQPTTTTTTGQVDPTTTTTTGQVDPTTTTTTGQVDPTTTTTTGQVDPTTTTTTTIQVDPTTTTTTTIQVDPTTTTTTTIQVDPTTTTTTGQVDPTTTTTTQAQSSFNYYFIRECFDGAISGGSGDGIEGDAVIRSVNDLSGWSHILIPRFPGDTDGISEIYNVTDQAAYDSPAGQASDYGGIDVDAISGVAQKTSCSGATTTTTTQAQSSFNYYFIRECFDGAISGGGGDGTNGDAVIRSANDLSGWSHILIPRFPGDTDGISEIYNVTNQAAYDSPAGQASDYGGIDVDTISGVAQKTSCSGATTTTTTQATGGDCTSYYLLTGSGQSYGRFDWTNCDGTTDSVTLGADANFGPICTQSIPVITNAVNASVSDEGPCGTTVTPTTTTTTQAPLTSFFTTNTNLDASNVCDQLVTVEKWHDGLAPNPTVSDTVYDDIDGNDTATQGFYANDNGEYFELTVDGTVVQVTSCGGSGGL